MAGRSEPKDLPVACRCGEVRGVLRGASRATVNRCLCYCDDCQAFLRHLGREDLLDDDGGSDIVQVAPAALEIDRGTEKLRAVRLSDEGMYRWYASCCRTPIGNTVGVGVPFVGMARAVLGSKEEVDAAISGPRAGTMKKFATRPVAGPHVSILALARMFAHVARLLLGWKLTGKGRPHPFFEPESGRPRFEVKVLTPEERAALRSAPPAA